MQDGLFNEIVNIIKPHAKNLEGLKNVSLATEIQRDLQVNSTRFVDIVLEFEDKFGLTISDQDADKIQTVGDAVELVQRLKH